MIKNFLTLFLMLTIVFCSGYRKPDKYTIQAEKNAFYHNNVGLNHLKDRIYYAAIQEFKIAISLSPSTQASAIFYNNLGDTYVYIGHPEEAEKCYEEALKLYGLNFQYYLNLIKTYKILGKIDSKINELKNSDNVYDRIKLGLLYIENNEKRKGINILDEVCISEPDLIITTALKQHLKRIIKEL